MISERYGKVLLRDNLGFENISFSLSYGLTEPFLKIYYNRVRDEYSFFKEGNEFVNSFFKLFLSDSFLISVFTLFFLIPLLFCIISMTISYHAFEFRSEFFEHSYYVGSLLVYPNTMHTLLFCFIAQSTIILCKTEGLLWNNDMNKLNINIRNCNWFQQRPVSHFVHLSPQIKDMWPYPIPKGHDLKKMNLIYVKL